MRKKRKTRVVVSNEFEELKCIIGICSGISIGIGFLKMLEAIQNGHLKDIGAWIVWVIICIQITRKAAN